MDPRATSENGEITTNVGGRSFWGTDGGLVDRE
jgi:hypothetical protein